MYENALQYSKFIKLLDRKNPHYAITRELLEQQQEHILRVSKRGPGLYEHLKDVLDPLCLPIVDRKFGYVLDCRGGHELIIAAILAYNLGTDNRPLPEVSERAWGPHWLEEKTGYYFTGAYGHPRIWVPVGYKPDRLDRDIFIEHRVLCD